MVVDLAVGVAVDWLGVAVVFVVGVQQDFIKQGVGLEDKAMVRIEDPRAGIVKDALHEVVMIRLVTTLGTDRWQDVRKEVELGKLRALGTDLDVL